MLLSKIKVAETGINTCRADFSGSHHLLMMSLMDKISIKVIFEQGVYDTVRHLTVNASGIKKSERHVVVAPNKLLKDFEKSLRRSLRGLPLLILGRGGMRMEKSCGSAVITHCEKELISINKVAFSWKGTSRQLQ